MWGAVAAGIGLGVAYTLSPLTVLCLGALLALTRWAGRDLTGRERQWFFALMTIAIVSRLLIIAALFLSADDSRPYATFFGDEEIFKSRPIWLRNWGLGVPISTADTVAAFDETGMSGHMYVLAFLQALVGDAPYGVHLFNVTAYVSAALLLHRLARASFGRLVALGGLTVLLFLPSLFAWSISALKEPVYILLAAVEVACVVAVVRSPRWWQGALAAATLVLLAVSLESLRKGTTLVVAIGAVVGLAAGAVVRRPRVLLLALIVVPVVAAGVLSRPGVQERIRGMALTSVRYHAGHVVTPGTAYWLINPRYYVDWLAIRKMPDREIGQFVVRAVGSYFLEPLPSSLESWAMWAYLPEHLMWLALAALAPLGIIRGLKRDPLLTCVLVEHASVIILAVAVNSGNIGTLIRHRGLSLPYTVWLSMLGACSVVDWLAQRPTAVIEGTNAHGIG